MEILKRKSIIQRNSDFGAMFVVIVIIFAFALVMLILSYAFGQIKPKLIKGLTSSQGEDANANVTAMLDKSGVALTRINVLYPLLIAGLFGYVFISALFFKSHPAFFFIGIMILGVALIIGAVFSNVYERISTTDTFADTADDFSIMELFVKNLPLLTLIFFVAIAIIAWTRAGDAGGGM